MNLDPYFTHTQKFNSKWLTDLNQRAMFIKFLEEYKVENLYDLGLDKDFLDTTEKAWSIK